MADLVHYMYHRMIICLIHAKNIFCLKILQVVHEFDTFDTFDNFDNFSTFDILISCRLK